MLCICSVDKDEVTSWTSFCSAVRAFCVAARSVRSAASMSFGDGDGAGSFELPLLLDGVLARSLLGVSGCAVTGAGEGCACSEAVLSASFVSVDHQ